MEQVFQVYWNTFEVFIHKIILQHNVVETQML